MPLRQDVEMESIASTPTPPRALLDAPLSRHDESQLNAFRTLLRQFLCVKDQQFNSQRVMTPNLRVNENRRGPVSNSSPYRGVTQHKKTRKWESHFWKQGKQLYCGAFGDAADAAKAHDILALRIKGDSAVTNFLSECYGELRPLLEQLSEVDVIDSLRRCAQGDDAPRRTKRARLLKESSEVVKSTEGVAGEALRPLQRELDPATYANNYYYQDPFLIQPSLFTPMPPEHVTTSFPHMSASTSRWEELHTKRVLIEWDIERRVTDEWLDIDISAPLSSRAQVPILQGHVIHSDPPLPQSQAESVRKPIQTPPRDEAQAPSNGSSSDQEMQAIVRAVSFSDELEIQRHIAEGLVESHHTGLPFL